MFPEKEKAILRELYKRKCIPLPHGGQNRILDTTKYLPVVDHPHMQRLKEVKQLANAHRIFPDATHSRFLHSLDTACWQIQRSEFWSRYGMITPEDAEHLNVYALIHDIGHGPFSHVLDRVCSSSHDENGAKKITEMKREIEKCGVSFARIKALFDEEDPLYKSVMHHPLGTDKFSYLSLDAVHCMPGAPDLGYLPEYIFWLDGQMMVHVKCADDAIDLKWFYIKMYRKVYLRKSCLIGQRVLEKEIFHLLHSGKLDESSLWDLTDEQLVALICRTARGRRGYERYKYRSSKCVVAFKMDGFKWTENVSEKPLSIIEKDVGFFDVLSDNSSPKELDKKERELAKLLGIDPLDLDIVPPMAVYRFTPPPLTIVNGYKTFIDNEEYKDDAAAIQERARACTVMRVCVTRELRSVVHKQTKMIEEFFDEWVKELQR
ncbi:HD domain-containing protein [Patescibacteria group bacterium]|nr:HD domain-containing protein [Patescibacteria group bacterium]